MDPSTTATESTEVIGLRADEDPREIINELLKGSDNAMKVDCAGPRVSFIVAGYFVFPRGSLNTATEVRGAA